MTGLGLWAHILCAITTYFACVLANHLFLVPTGTFLLWCVIALIAIVGFATHGLGVFREFLSPRQPARHTLAVNACVLVSATMLATVEQHVSFSILAGTSAPVGLQLNFATPVVAEGLVAGMVTMIIVHLYRGLPMIPEKLSLLGIAGGTVAFLIARRLGVPEAGMVITGIVAAIAIRAIAWTIAFYVFRQEKPEQYRPKIRIF